jgi:hypothetical protein
MNDVRLDQKAIDALGDDPAVAQQLRPRAQSILVGARGKTPSWVDATFFVKAGVGPRGAFAQAIGRGSGIVLAEYGGRNSPAHAMFRSSAR